MKRFMFTLMAAMVAVTSFAQSQLVAALSHGDKVTMYYEAGAFQKAYNAAASGDIITLSGGAFTGDFKITKAVTVRGTGIDASNPTKISGRMEFNIPASDTCRFSVEGVRFNSEFYLYGSFANPYFLKCQFYRIYFYNYSGTKNYWSSAIKDALFVNCKVTTSLDLCGSTAVKFSHCYVSGVSNYADYSSKAQFINCVVYGYFNSFLRSSFVNSIMCGYNSSLLPAETVAMNCTALNKSGNVYYNSSIYNNMQGSQVSCSTSTYEELFKSYRGDYSDSQTFELTDAAKTKFLGTDGTQIGLYGGEYPYTSTPAYPRITKLNVAKQTTADDKLSVEIEVSAAE